MKNSAIHFIEEINDYDSFLDELEKIKKVSDSPKHVVSFNRQFLRLILSSMSISIKARSDD